MTPSDTAHPEGERELLIERLRAWPDSPDRRDDYSVKSIQALMNEAASALSTPPSRPQGEEGLWRPISEAPRDSTPILYWEPGCAVAEPVCFLNGFKIAEHGWYPYAGGNWHIAQGFEHQDAVWQPIPAPPGLSNQGKPSS